MARGGGKGGRITIELFVDDKGTVKLVEAKRKVEDLGDKTERVGRKGQKAGQEMASGLNKASAAAMSLGKQLAAVVGISLSVAGAFYLIRTAWRTWYDLIARGVTAVQDYRSAIIGAASVLTDMTDVKTGPEMKEAYGAWKDYFDWLWHASIEADKKVAASGREVFQAAAELAKKGVVATTQEQVEIAGRLMDRIRAVAPLTGNMLAQVRAEIRDLLQGHVRMGSQLATIFKQIDSNFEENIKKARAEGKVWEYLETQLRGIEIAAGDISALWESVWATLKSAFDEVLIVAFGDAFDDIVEMGKELADWLIKDGELTEEGARLALALSEAWEAAKDEIHDALKYFLEHPDEIIGAVKNIAAATGEIAAAAAKAASAFAQLVGYIEGAVNKLREWRAAMPDMRAGGLMFKEPTTTKKVPFMGGEKIPRTPLDAINEINEQQKAEREAAEKFVKDSIKAAKRQAILDKIKSIKLREYKPEAEGGGGGGGGKGAKDTAKEIERLMDTLEKEVARSAGTAYDQIEKWYDDTIEKINEYARTAEEKEAAIALAKEAKAAKMQKIEDDFLKWYAGQTGDTLKQIELEHKRVTDKWGERNEINAVREAKTQAEILKREGDLLEQKKAQLEAVLAMTSRVEEQIPLMEEISRLEAEIALLRLDSLHVMGKVTDELYEQIKATIKLDKEQRDYNRTLDKATGIRGGARRYRERRPSAAERRAASTERFLGDFDRKMEDTMKSIGHMLLGEDVDFEEIAKEFAAMFIDYMIELLWSQVSDVLMSIFSVGMESAGNVLLQFFTQAGNFLMQVGQMMAQLLIAAGQIVAALIRAALGLFGLFHTGGIVSHTGALLAHSGLALGPDERLVRAKVGEMIISRPGTDKLLGQDPNAFLKLNRGELPEGGRKGGTKIVNNFVFKPPQTSADYARLARKIVPAIERRDRRRIA